MNKTPMASLILTVLPTLALASQGGVSSGTTPEFVEAQCVSDDGNVTTLVLRSAGSQSLHARTILPRAASPNLAVKKTPAALPGTPAEKPLRFTHGRAYRLEIYLTAMPVPATGPIERRGHLLAEVAGIRVNEDVNCTLNR